MEIPSVTLVTACFDLRRFHPSSRTIEDSLAGMEIVLRMPVYLIIHCDSTFYAHIRAKRCEYGFESYTIFVQDRFEDLWSYQYVDDVKRNRAIYWPTADERTCAESHLLCCNKFDFVQQAMEQNPFQTARFGWIDSNLSIHSTPDESGAMDIKIAENYTTNMVPRVLSQITDDKFHIQVMNVNDKRFLLPEHTREYYQHYRWVVCGCFFVCGLTVGAKILQRLKDVVRDTILAGYGHAEEMCYLEILEEFPDDVVKSYGDYRQILNNFVLPTRNIGYVIDFIIEGYFCRQYYRECMECCRAVLASFDQHLIPMDYHLYMRTMRIYQSCIAAYMKDTTQEKIDTWCKRDTNARDTWRRIVGST